MIIKYLNILFIIILVYKFAAAQEAQQITSYDTFLSDEHHDSLNPVYLFVTIMPGIPGGKKALKEFINSVDYPKCATDSIIEGVVVMQFIVEKNGRLSQVKALKSPHSCLTNASIEYLNERGNWIPGKRDGKEVACLFTLPLVFKMPPGKK